MQWPPSLFLIFFSTLASSHLLLATPLNNFTDLESLLAFKAHAADPRGILAANWTTSTSFCRWIGVQCSRRHRARVAAIRLPDMSIQGTISPYLANLSFLSRLDLRNNTLAGPIPEGLGRLPRLAGIILERNALSGPIPSTIFNMTSVINIYLGFNNLSGTLPSNASSIWLPRLRNISLSSNRLSGNIAPGFAGCRHLHMLSLSKNRFGGTIPAELGSIPELAFLYLGRNRLSGTIPASLGNLTKLAELDVGMNDNLTGVIPEELGGLRNLQYLALANCDFVGSIPVSLLNCSLVNSFDLSGNRLAGAVPAGIGSSLPLLNWFHIGDNELTGGLGFIPSLSNCRDLEFFQVWGNKLEGVIPDSVGNLSSNLQLFLAFENLISGSIPAALGNLSGLAFMSLHMNQLTGSIPSEIARLHRLQSMNLAFNRLSGSIPYEIGRMTNLNVIDITYNAVSGSIPDSLANITMMQYLWLHSNNLSSGIPAGIWTVGSLLHLYLSQNNLSGSLSPQVGNLKSLILLDVSMNQLSGEIPHTLGDLQMLAKLDLSRNSFEGQIPDTFGGLISVTYLNLSANSLSGGIPDSLANLSYLGRLDLSFNKLRGKIPNGRVFSNRSIPSLFGNGALCGAPQLHISPCADDSRGRMRFLAYAIPLAAFSVVLLACVCVYAFHWRRTKVKKLEDSTATTNFDDCKVVPQQELVRATANFSEANLLGRGGFGSVFRGCMDNGSVAAVKVLNLEVERGPESFNAEFKVLQMVRHRNLVKIIGVCFRTCFKALVLQFMPNGSLEQWLYSENYLLNLIQRLNIVVDVAAALEHLHHHHPHVVVHCDLKPTNVLLDAEMVAHVSDFGIARLLLGDSEPMALATESIPGTIGYIAPEYSSTGVVSRMGDVYSFGILLLETFAGKRPTDAMFGGQLSLREWICEAQPARILEVVDGDLLKDRFRGEGSIRDSTALQQCLSSVVELGLLCSSWSPKDRIPMTVVATRLQKIRMEYLSTSAALE